MKQWIKRISVLLAVLTLTGCVSVDYRISDLHRAAGAGNTAEVQRLLDAGANVNAGDIAGQTPLIYAAYGGHIETIKILLERGAQVNVCDCGGFMPLHKAAEYGHEDVVILLLDKGAGINARSTHGYTPLFLAACEGRVNVVRVLLARGADIGIKNNDGETAFAVAKSKGYEAVANMIADAPAQRARAAQQQQALLLQNLSVNQLLEQKDFSNEAFVAALTEKLIEAKNRELPAVIVKSTVDQRIALVTTAEKRLTEAQASIVELNGRAEDAIRQNQNAAEFRSSVGKLQAYIAVLAEIKSLLMQS